MKGNCKLIAYRTIFLSRERSDPPQRIRCLVLKVDRKASVEIVWLRVFWHEMNSKYIFEDPLCSSRAKTYFELRNGKVVRQLRFFFPKHDPLSLRFISLSHALLPDLCRRNSVPFSTVYLHVKKKMNNKKYSLGSQETYLPYGKSARTPFVSRIMEGCWQWNLTFFLQHWWPNSFRIKFKICL